MHNNEMLSKAIALTAQKFEGKLDKGGHPYILHCLTVMYGVSHDAELMCAAVMHDLVEDTDITLHDLIAMGFSARVCRTVGILTHEKSVPYMDYIKAISLNEDARKIKMKDLEHNTQLTRLKGLSKRDFDRLEKYCTAYEYLKKV